MISRKDKCVFDFWTYRYCRLSVNIADFSINKDEYETVLAHLHRNEFILDFQVHKTILFKELFS